MNEKMVPLPSNRPISAEAEFEEVLYNVKPAMDRIEADTRIDLKVSPKDL